MRGLEAQLWTDHHPDLAEGGTGWTAAELSYAARGLQTEVAHLLAHLDAVPDPALQRLASSVRRRSDLVTSTRRLLHDESAPAQRPPLVFDLTEIVDLTVSSLNGSSPEPAWASMQLPDMPVRVMGHARSLHRAMTRASTILASDGRGTEGASVSVASTRAGARLDLSVPGVELSAVDLIEVVESFLAATSRPSAASGVNVQVVAGSVCVTTDPVMATTSAEETTVSAWWELEGSLVDVA